MTDADKFMDAVRERARVLRAAKKRYFKQFKTSLGFPNPVKKLRVSRSEFPHKKRPSAKLIKRKCVPEEICRGSREDEMKRSGLKLGKEK